MPCSTPYWQSLSCFLLTTGVRTPGELLRRPSARIGLIQSNSIRASSRKEVPSAAIGMYRVRGKHEEKTRWCCSPLSVCVCRYSHAAALHSAFFSSAPAASFTASVLPVCLFASPCVSASPSASTLYVSVRISSPSSIFLSSSPLCQFSSRCSV